MGLSERLHLPAEGGIGGHALGLVPGDRLQDDPRIVRELPQRGIQLPPDFVGSVIPRPAQIQCQLGQPIESLDIRGQETVDRVTDPDLVAHGFSFCFGSDEIPASARMPHLRGRIPNSGNTVA